MCQVVTSGTSERRKSYHHGNLRADAIATALELIRSAGAPFFSLREVAMSLGVSHGALYRHFTDRDALLAAVATQGFEALAEAQQAALQGPHQDSRARLEALCRVQYEFARSRPAEYRAMFNSFLNGAGRDDEALHAASGPSLTALVAAVDAWLVEIGRDRGSSRAAAAVVWSAVHGLSLLTVDGLLVKLTNAGDEPDGMISLVTAAILDGIAQQTEVAKTSALDTAMERVKSLN